MIQGTFTLESSELGLVSCKNKFLAAGRDLLLRTMFMAEPVNSSWRIGLIKSFTDPSDLPDDQTFLSKNWEELTDYTYLTPSGDEYNDLRVPLTPDDWGYQDISQSIVTRINLHTVRITATSAVTISGMFLCQRADRDSEEATLYAIGALSSQQIVYPGQEFFLKYSPGFQS